MKSPITTHILDTAQGRPAGGVAVILEKQTHEKWLELARSVTNENGRIDEFAVGPGEISPGRYRLIFDTESYFRSCNLDHFFPEVQIQFEIRNSEEHYHVPLLLSTYGYSTYRGS